MIEKNCYLCIHRRKIADNAHSRCAHPEVEAEGPNKMAELLSMLGGGRAMPMASQAAQKLNIAAEAHGVRMGWFAWPYNFDPVWLRNCNGFEEKNLP